MSVKVRPDNEDRKRNYENKVIKKKIDCTIFFKVCKLWIHDCRLPPPPPLCLSGSPPTPLLLFPLLLLLFSNLPILLFLLGFLVLLLLHCIFFFYSFSCSLNLPVLFLLLLPYQFSASYSSLAFNSSTPPTFHPSLLSTPSLTLSFTPSLP